ncbi:MAG: PP0621 family protein [Burkholderiaceae bacterium]|nr:PP0621 family protein [Burkholderiaceae bacterium]
MKLVVVLIAVLLLVWLLLGSSRRRAKKARRDSPAARPAPQVEGMVTCAHCGVHLPGSLALQVRGQAYCSEAHRDAGPRVP